MLDLNKLRSEFEAQHSDKVFKIVKFDEATNAYCLHAHLPLTEINLSALAEINYGWDLWQKAKAQAVQQSFEIGRLQDRITELLDERQDLYAQINNDQAVPEGYVLLPRVPTEKMFQAYERYSVAPMSTLSKTGYKAMVEASESGAEG
ncbi:TPA: hypothetical protein OVL15_001836 [Acinetobacter baumannii]|nr:hypothetical protein [Acinetobacter baumannii]HCU8693954.1 hypothetical protein [Acinetobacter baumannii]